MKQSVPKVSIGADQSARMTQLFLPEKYIMLFRTSKRMKAMKVWVEILCRRIARYSRGLA